MKIRIKESRTGSGRGRLGRLSDELEKWVREEERRMRREDYAAWSDDYNELEKKKEHAEAEFEDAFKSGEDFRDAKSKVDNIEAELADMELYRPHCDLSTIPLPPELEIVKGKDPDSYIIRDKKNKNDIIAYLYEDFSSGYDLRLEWA